MPRSGFKTVWRTLYCNKDSDTRAREETARKEGKYRGGRGNPPPIIRPNRADRRAWGRGGGPADPALVAEVQPMIIPAQKQQQHLQMQQQRHGQPGTSYLPTVKYQNHQQQPLLDISMQCHDTSFEVGQHVVNTVV